MGNNEESNLTVKRRIVLVGGGHAHVQVLEAFAKRRPAHSQVTVIVDTPIATYSGMVPGFVAGRYRATDLQIDVTPLAHACGAEMTVARAIEIDAQQRRIHLDNGASIAYDIASLDIGSTVAGLDLPGVLHHAVPTRPIGLFVQRVTQVDHRARAHPNDEPFHVVIVGGGIGGVELAFTLQRRLEALTGQLQMTLLEHNNDILEGQSDALVQRIHRLARSRGIAIRCSCHVARAEADSVTLAHGDQLPCHALVWVTGAVSQPIFANSGLSTDDRGFLRVRSTLQAQDHDELMAAGDCCTLIEHPRTPKAGVYAVRQGPRVTNNIHALLAGNPLRSYRPQRDFLTLINLGDGTAVGAKWGCSFQGRWVMTLKNWIDRRFMRRFQMPFQDDTSMTNQSNDDKRQQIDAMYQKVHSKFSGIAEITAEELKNEQNESELVLVDVRTPEEQAVSMIPGAVTSVEFERDASKYKDSKIVAYCTIGGRSGHYTHSLQSQGYNAYNLKGAILSWTHVGGELTHSGEPTHKVHVHGAKFNLVADGYEGVW